MSDFNQRAYETEPLGSRNRSYSKEEAAQVPNQWWDFLDLFRNVPERRIENPYDYDWAKRPEQVEANYAEDGSFISVPNASFTSMPVPRYTREGVLYYTTRKDTDETSSTYGQPIPDVPEYNQNRPWYRSLPYGLGGEKQGDISDYALASFIFNEGPSVAAPFVALKTAKPQTQNIVMKGKYEQQVTIPLNKQGLKDARTLNDALSKDIDTIQSLSRLNSKISKAIIPQYSSGAVVQTKDGPMYRTEPGTMQSTFMTTTGGDQPNEFQQLVLKLEEGDSFPKLYDFPSNQPTPFISQELNEQLGPDGNRLEGLTYQEIQSIGRAAKTYELKRAYKDAGTVEGYARMTVEVEKAFSDLLGDDFDRDLVRQYMLAVSKHEEALTELQKITNDRTGKLWDKQHANALRNLEHSGRMLGNKGLFPAFNYPDVLDQTPLGKPIVNIEREGNRPDRFARGADFQRTLMRVLGKPLSLHESILYFYDQDMFYFYKELSPLQRQQLVDSSRTRSGGRIKSELTVAENINQALESMKFGQETMSGKLGRPLTDKERLKALVDLATSELLKKRKYKRTDFKNSPRQGNVFYDIDTGEATDYSPDPGIGSSWDIEDPDPENKYSK